MFISCATGFTMDCDWNSVELKSAKTTSTKPRPQGSRSAKLNHWANSNTANNNFHSRHDGLQANENIMPVATLEGTHKQLQGMCQDAPRDSTDATTRNSQRLPAGAEFGTGRDPTFFLELVLGYCCQWPASPVSPWGLMCSNPFNSWFMASKALFRLRLSPGLLSENVPCSRSSLAA